MGTKIEIKWSYQSILQLEKQFWLISKWDRRLFNQLNSNWTGTSKSGLERVWSTDWCNQVNNDWVY